MNKNTVQSNIVTPTPTEMAAMAHARRHALEQEQMLRMELDTYCVLDGRSELKGCVRLPQEGAGRRVALTAKARETGLVVWQQTIPTGPDTRDAAITLPVASMPGGYYTVEALDDGGRCCEVNLVLREDAPAETAGSSPAAHPADYLAEARAVVDRIIAEQTRRLGGRPDGAPFLTVGRRTGIGYRSLGARAGNTFKTYWFPEEPFELDTFRLDHDLWPVLDALSRSTGDPRYRAMTDGMIDALAGPGFDPRSGLLHFSEESDLDVLREAPHSKRMDSDQPRFKPINGGPSSDMHLDRFWVRLPRQTHRWLRATYYGLVTSPDTMDFNRFCMYGFDDAERVPSLTPNPGHCAFETAAASMILYWSSCWAYAGDAECLDWTRRMTRKWAAVQHPGSGLVPDFFGAIDWKPGDAQPPPAGQWASSGGSALAALQWMRAAAMLRRRSGAEDLAGELDDMGRRLALGVARHAYDPERRVFIDHLCLDGQPHAATARYCFRTQAEKDAAVRREPQMAQVAVYDGTGLYRQPNYHEHCAGSSIPCNLAQVAALARDPELIERLGPMAADAVEEAGKLTGAFTPEGRWTFRATAWYALTCVHLFRLADDARRLDQARQLVDREIAALETVRAPQWWRLRERAIWLDALLALDEALQGRDARWMRGKP